MNPYRPPADAQQSVILGELWDLSNREANNEGIIFRVTETNSFVVGDP